MRFNVEVSACGRFWYAQDSGTFGGAYVSAAAGCGPGDAYVFTDEASALMVCCALNNANIEKEVW